MHSRKKRRFGSEIIWHLIDLSVWFLSLLCAILTILSLLVPFINPSHTGILAWVPLLYPIYYISNALFLFYWLVRWNLRHCLLMLAVTMLASLKIGLYCRPEFSLNQNEKVKIARKYFTRLVSYNVACYDKQPMVDSIIKLDADIVCLQEFFNKKSSNWNKLKDGMHCSSTSWGNIRFGCHTLSRYPIVEEGLIQGLSIKDALWTLLKIGRDTLCVINVHLRSTGMQGRDVSYVLHGEFLQDSLRQKQVKSMVSRFVDNAKLRSEQVEKLESFIQASRYDICLAGDINDVPLSYTYRHLSKHLDDTFTRHRLGYVYTYTNFISMLRLDQVFISKNIVSLGYEVRKRISYSDHYPVISELKFNK